MAKFFRGCTECDTLMLRYDKDLRIFFGVMGKYGKEFTLPWKIGSCFQNGGIRGQGNFDGDLRSWDREV